MSKYSRLKVFNTMIETGMVPVFYHPEFRVAVSVVDACTAGGGHCFEFTNRGDLAHEVFKELVIHFKSDDRVILGAGSIIDPATAALYIQLGANFIVGPVLNPEVARVCNRRKVAYIPGCGSATEISTAEELGAEICKIFPGEAIGGAGFVRDVLGPMPWARLMPTGGVDTTEESITNWFKAGVTCVGMGSKLFTKESISSGNYGLITEKTKQVLEWILKVRSGKSPIS